MFRIKKLRFMLGVFLVLSASVFSLGLGVTYGPIANEKYLLDCDICDVSFYDMPLFLGGLYYKHKTTANTFIYSDIVCSVHQAQYNNTGRNDTNVLSYIHSDFNYFPFNQNLFYVGSGLECIFVSRLFSAPVLNYNYYTSTHFFAYLNTGVAIPVGPVEFGIKLLYRLLPFDTQGRPGNGELSLQFGIK